MYLAAYPVALTVRNSAHVENETSAVFQNVEQTKAYRTGFGFQAKNYLARDTTYLFFALFLVMAVERTNIETLPDFTVWAIMFEIVSAYGNVGLSLGYGNSPLTFSAQWHTFSKFVLCVVMLLGRHRGLPDSIDKAVSLGYVDIEETIPTTSIQETNESAVKNRVSVDMGEFMKKKDSIVVEIPNREKGFRKPVKPIKLRVRNTYNEV